MQWAFFFAGNINLPRPKINLSLTGFNETNNEKKKNLLVITSIQAPENILQPEAAKNRYSCDK